jgi:hypothetical protein
VPVLKVSHYVPQIESYVPQIESYVPQIESYVPQIESYVGHIMKSSYVRFKRIFKKVWILLNNMWGT